MHDPSNMHRIIASFPQQCADARSLANGIVIDKPVKNILVTGIGGSALPGDILRCFYWNHLDILVNKDYTIPHSVSEETLVFVSSFSGNTEESLSAAEFARKKGARIVGISKGHRLDAFCKKHGFPSIVIPTVEGMQARSALGYLLFPMISVIEQSGLVEATDPTPALEALKDPAIEERGKHLASTLQGKSVLLYTPNDLYGIGYGWKKRLNETSKTHAFSNVFPEVNHNEISSFQTMNKEFYSLLFLDEDGDERVRRRMELSSDLIPQKTILPLKGERLAKLLGSLHLGDWTAYYLALAKGIDPTPVPLQEKVKAIMQDNVL